MADPITDIIVTTRNRLDCLQETLAYIYERTRAPYRLHVLDDASTDGNVNWLMGEWKAGRIHHLLLHGERVGAMAQLNQGAWLAVSDPVVFTDDDVLCPDVDPCWLERGRTAILERPRLGILALNHPGATRRIIDKDDVVTYCKFIGGTFMFARRSYLNWCPLPHYRNNFGITPTTQRSSKARKRGFLVGYLTKTYCKHFGGYSVLTEKESYRAKDHIEFDPVTLEPVMPKFRK